MREPPCSLSEAAGPPLTYKSERSKENSARFPRLSFDALARETANPPIRSQHTKRDIMVKHRQLRDDLLVERQPARAPDELPLRQESIVEPHPPPDPIPLLREPQSRHHHKVNEIDRHRLPPTRLPHPRAARRHVIRQAVDLDRQHPSLVPA